MSSKTLLVAALSSVALAAPFEGQDANKRQATATVAPAVTGNPFDGVQQFANPYYASEILEFAVPEIPEATAVAEVPTFQWMDTTAKIDIIPETLDAIRAANEEGASPPYAASLVVYNLPDRDCAAAASNGELHIDDGGVALYKEYIDTIAAMIDTYSDLRFILVIEPDSLANMVTNLNIPKCANAQAAYYECTQYAVENLNLDNVAMYLDGGHAGWLGWEANLQPAADMFAQVYANASQPATLRGLVTNVSNYNGFRLTSPPAYTDPNPNYDEEKFINAFAPLLASAGWEGAHFITDVGRSGKQPTGQEIWGDWCNVADTGFGPRPTTETGNELVDALVWVKPGGESDGTSDSSADRYDEKCGVNSAVKPAPEAGTWFQAYFAQLFENANPPFTGANRTSKLVRA